MSNRALRRLLQEREKQKAQSVAENGAGGDQEDGEEEEEEDSPPGPARRNRGKGCHVNPFQLLADDGEKEEEEEGDERPEENGEAAVSKPAASSTNKKKKKKKKKKNKAEDSASSQAVENQGEVEDEIDASLQEVNRILGEAGVPHAHTDSSSSGAGGGGGGGGADQPGSLTVNMKALLNVEYKHLNPMNEMRKRFGSRIVQAEEQGRARQRNQPLRRQSRLVQPKEEWHRLGRTGLSMTMIDGGTGVGGGGQVFTIEHSPQYRNVQFRFLDAVRTFDPQNVADLLNEHPYHIDSLITLSEVFHFGEDHEAAVNLIERALHVFESAFHPRFNMAAGNCRLNFLRQENRGLFLALFKHILAVSQRGCNRTALELCKVLLSFDPDGDPMCTLLMIDFFALRSHEYSFLVRLFEEWESFRNLSQLPNFAFSVPLALFRLSKKDPAQAARADAMLEESLLMFPGLLMTLLDKCGVSPDKEVSSHSFFGPGAQNSQTPALRQLVALYVGRSHLLWKEREVLEWLEAGVRATLRRVDAKDPRVADFAQKRKVRYQGTPRNIYRHLLISNIKDATATLPPEIAEQDSQMMSHDPLPPVDAIVSYQRNETPRNGEPSSMLGLFLRSMLPNYNAQGGAGPQGGAEGAEEWGDGGEEGAAGGNPELRRGVGVLMGAMRDLLNNIQLAPPPVNNAEDEEEEEERPPEEWD